MPLSYLIAVPLFKRTLALLLTASPTAFVLALLGGEDNGLEMGEIHWFDQMVIEPR